jgi:2-phospho-L-lactate guanylyltransferase
LPALRRGLGGALMWAIIPVKDLSGAKARLAPALTPEERRDLFRAMLGDVLAALGKTPSLDGIAMITRDDEAAGMAARIGAEVISEDANSGQTAAVTHGVRTLMARGVHSILQVPGDVPLATAGEIEQVIHAHAGGQIELAGDGADGPAHHLPFMTIVPARDKQGSNCVVCSPPDAVPLRFGDNSFFPHVDAARAAGIRPRVIELPGLGLDIDTPEDLAELIARPIGDGGPTGAHSYLAESGIAARLAAGQKTA